MPIIIDNTLNQVRTIAMGGDDRTVKARRLAELVRRLGEYRWVGVYDVTPKTVSIIAWVGPKHRTIRRFRFSKGLTGAAIQEKAHGYLRRCPSDRRYLYVVRQHAFGNHRGRVLAPGGESVVGTIDVESDQSGMPFPARDQADDRAMR